MGDPMFITLSIACYGSIEDWIPLDRMREFPLKQGFCGRHRWKISHYPLMRWKKSYAKVVSRSIPNYLLILDYEAREDFDHCRKLGTTVF